MKFPNFLSMPDCVVGIPVLRAIFCFSLVIPKALFSENVSPGIGVERFLFMILIFDYYCFLLSHI